MLFRDFQRSTEQRVMSMEQHLESSTGSHSENNIQTMTFTKTFRELRLANSIQRITFKGLQSKNIQRITLRGLHAKNIQRLIFRDLHNFHIFLVQERNYQGLQKTRTYFKNFEGQKTLSNNEQKKIVIERKYLLKRYLVLKICCA